MMEFSSDQFKIDLASYGLLQICGPSGVLCVQYFEMLFTPLLNRRCVLFRMWEDEPFAGTDSE